MSAKITRLTRAVRLDEPVMRLAEALARQCDLTVPQLIEALLLASACPEEDDADVAAAEDQAPAPGHQPSAEPEPTIVRRPRRQGSGRVICLDAARRRRRGSPSATSAALRMRTDELVRRSQALRRRSEAACFAAQQARASAARAKRQANA